MLLYSRENQNHAMKEAPFALGSLVLVSCICFIGKQEVYPPIWNTGCKDEANTFLTFFPLCSWQKFSHVVHDSLRLRFIFRCKVQIFVLFVSSPKKIEISFSDVSNGKTADASPQFSPGSSKNVFQSLYKSFGPVVSVDQRSFQSRFNDVVA